MKNILVFFFYLIVMLINVNVVNAQQKISLDMLVNKDWAIQFPEEGHPRQGWYFTDTEQISFIVDEGKREERHWPFYLSDKEETVFDSKKIGKSKEGYFIIVKQYVKDGEKQSWEMKVMNFQICMLSDERLIVRNVRNNSIITFVY